MSDLASHLAAAPPSRGAADRDRAVLVTHLVAYATGVAAQEIAAADRRATSASEARALAMYLCHTELGWPLARVGAAFGRDRTTVGHACRRVEDRRDDAVFDARVSELGVCVRACPSGPRAVWS